MIGIEKMRWIGPYPPLMGFDVQGESNVALYPTPSCVPNFGYWLDDDKEYPQDELELMLEFQERLDKE